MPPCKKIFVKAFKNNNIVLNVNCLRCHYTLFFDIFQHVLHIYFKFYVKSNFIITITIAPGIPRMPIKIDVIKFNPM